MLTIRLSDEVESILDHLAESTGKTKSYYAREAILAYVASIEKHTHWQAKGATTLQAAEDALNGVGEFHYDTFSLLDDPESK